MSDAIEAGSASRPSAAVRFGPDGLVPAIVQDRLTGHVRMVAYMNAEALAATRRTGRATFFSRSRGELWEKGATSGHTLAVHRIVADCDGDALLVLVDPTGPSCHTGSPSCFFRPLDEAGHPVDGDDAAPELLRLERTIEARRAATAGQSYTRSLLDGGAPAIGAKLREEADELARALDGESDGRVASEAADVLYHALVGLASRGVPVSAVLAELARRSGTSGHVEKASRKG